MEAVHQLGVAASREAAARRRAIRERNRAVAAHPPRDEVAEAILGRLALKLEARAATPELEADELDVIADIAESHISSAAHYLALEDA